MEPRTLRISSIVDDQQPRQPQHHRPGQRAQAPPAWPGLSTIRPRPWNPMKVMNRPMPAAMASRSSSGNGRDHVLAHAQDRQQQEDHARDEHHAQGRLPGHAPAHAPG